MLHRPFKMVLVDDEPEIIDILSECIQDMFPGIFEVKIFSDPVNALEYIKEEAVLIVITDVRMPHINGDHLNLKIKQLGKGVQTIILTGNQSYMTAITCFRDGANGYISKPFEMVDIQKTIQSVLETILSWEKVFEKVTHQVKEAS
ncbi:response regulator [Pseudobacteriovorax antillogorgiicola]|uniref:Response regulator receiver domain-containing protein n=1 Tax=Pseudobacteriovorax antillogorgiicola TaxID=1513793 RepID=A0A1Y6C284_9BACT|nr:response regulator [Pseudobacteriovorax antillogorgiicola]TCS51147.1 response regulator receiver domain-containing protein [Pseudobacteriovorax antillogorgiicola]SMF38286.1 Response regulator receiver domain-containing protein [Pseudobacteriovorax antillogorgiicola]